MPKKTVLIVDDEPDLCEILSFDLQEAGFKTLTAQSGIQAIEILKKPNDVSAVVSDIRMANGNGIELLDMIKDRDTTKPIVMLMTGFSDISLEDAYHKGANALFPKPVVTQHIIDALNKALVPAQPHWKRKNERLELRVRVAYRSNPNEPEKASLTANIGRGGLFIELKPTEVYALGDIITFTLNFEDTRWPAVTGSGVVRWMRPDGPEGKRGIGVEFAHLTEDSHKILLSVFNAFKTRAFIPKH